MKMYAFAFLISILDSNTLAALLMYFYACFFNAFPKKKITKVYNHITPSITKNAEKHSMRTSGNYTHYAFIKYFY